jgi:hypothetical protein
LGVKPLSTTIQHAVAFPVSKVAPDILEDEFLGKSISLLSGCCAIETGEFFWLVVSTPLKNISQLGLLLQIYGKIKFMFQTTSQG